MGRHIMLTENCLQHWKVFKREGIEKIDEKAGEIKKAKLDKWEGEEKDSQYMVKIDS